MRKPAATSHRGVTRQAVAEAAADLVAADGLEALSVRQVANRLGVWPTTVMHHAGGRREGLLALLIEHLAAGIRTEPHGSWRARLTELGREIRRVALAHRGLADVAAALRRHGTAGATPRRRDPRRSPGRRSRPRRRAGRLRRLPHLRARQRRPPDDGYRPCALASVRDQALDQAEPDTYPALRRAARGGTTRDDDARFAGGLDLVLDAIAGRASR